MKSLYISTAILQQTITDERKEGLQEVSPPPPLVYLKSSGTLILKACGLRFRIVLSFLYWFYFKTVFTGEFNMKHHNLFKYKSNAGGGSLEATVITPASLTSNDRPRAHDRLLLSLTANTTRYVKAAAPPQRGDNPTTAIKKP